MKRLKKGDIVGRISYNKDIFFIIKDIKDKKNVLLEGLFVRIIADSDINDLELIDQKEINKTENLIEKGITKEENRNEIRTVTGKILHLDGDKRYSEKSEVVTHDLIKYDSIDCKNLRDSFDILKQYDVIGIDEGQFFPDLVEVCEELALLKKIIIIAQQ